MTGTIANILEAREKRWQHRCQLVENYQMPVISITLNIPGSRKKESVFVQAHSILVETFIQTLRNKDRIELLSFEQRTNDDGPEAFIVLEGEGAEIKEMAIGFEENHLLGRLLDIDVMDVNQRTISRRDLHHPDRRCLICGAAARQCISAARHSPEHVLEKVKQMLNSFLENKDNERE